MRRPLNEILGDVMMTPLGRELFRALVDVCGTHSETFTKDERSDTFARGRKSVGQMLEQAAKTHSFELYILSLKEERDEIENAAKGERYESF